MLKIVALPVADEPKTGQDLLDIEHAFVDGFEAVAKQAYDNAANKGFWHEGPGRNQAEQIALMHSELSEALEALRKDATAKDAKCIDYTNLECELADTVIRIMDFSHAYRLRVAEAIVAKMRYNRLRPFMHGKKF